ncbi:MAG: DUF1684 domain-containing protein [Acidobacteriota bacterium]|nr:DUF1684 domain-containing protein [Acidobacteriota bacterium]
MLIGIAAIVFVIAAPTNYSDSIHDWQVNRNAKLREPDSWLTLVGLYWLKPGNNTIGSAETNDLVLPKGSAPGQVGTLRLQGEKVLLLKTNGSSRTLSFDEDKLDVVHAGSVSFFIIKRGDKFAVRAKDSASPTLKNFEGLKYFPINPQFHFQARFTPDEKKVPILNILGQTEMQESPGVVEFIYRGNAYHLRPIFEGKTLFFLYKDPTNRTQTYQAGRMLNTPLPADGKVDLDFNRSYNPPCTFTPYATCPLPPRENTLPFPVEAGELRYGKGHVEYTASR